MKNASGKNHVAELEKEEKMLVGKIERMRSKGSSGCMTLLSDMRGRGAGLKIRAAARPRPAATTRLTAKRLLRRI